MINAKRTLNEAAKCALISMDSTLRSNLSVGLPLDLLIYERDALRVGKHVSIEADDPYFNLIHNQWGEQFAPGVCRVAGFAVIRSGSVSQPVQYKSCALVLFQRIRTKTAARLPDPASVSTAG